MSYDRSTPVRVVALRTGPCMGPIDLLQSSKSFARIALSVGSWEGCLRHAQNIVSVYSVALELAKLLYSSGTRINDDCVVPMQRDVVL